MQNLRSISFLPVLLGVALASACSSSDSSSSPATPTNQEGEAPLSSLDDLVQGAPAKGDLPEEGKADAEYPAQYVDLKALQSPVKSQGSRGVCSIFATIALMEHLYIAQGTYTNPDFSEQFLQWSVKTEVKQFTNTEGSSAQYNLQSLSRFGVVQETDWPYESYKWSSSNDPECGSGDNQPTKCYTNGSPPGTAMTATRWFLPSGKWINTSARSIKAHMTAKKQGLVVGGTFYYQAWNHRASTLPTNDSYWRKGYVTYPNDKDKEESLKKRAGHAIVLLGWDDNLEVQQRDGQGNLVVDSSGKPVMEKGFFLFKNSWGTASFGIENPQGAGYGWISMKYVDEFLDGYASGLPEVRADKEAVCNDTKDNDRDGKADCEDTDCSADPACQSTAVTYESVQSQAIIDNNTTGISSLIEVPDAGAIKAVSVTVDITHTYSGDLVVKLVNAAGTEVVLQDRKGGGDDDVKKTFAVSDFNGSDSSGTWKLVVIDTARDDVGTLNSWSITINR